MEPGEEVHEEYAYEPAELEELLRQAGFRHIRQYGELKLRAPKPGEGRIFLRRTKGILTSMADQIIRVLAKNAPVKASAITARDMVERARQIHRTLPVATAALGRALMAASMMGNQLKEDNGSVTLRIKGDGPLGGITAVSDSAGNARGYVVNPAVDLPLKGPAKLDVGSAVGRDGSLTVIKDLNLKEPYVGTVPLVSGEIAEDITSYFAESEQIPTACALGVLVDVDQSVLCAGGYLIQLLPGADDAAISAIERGIAEGGPGDRGPAGRPGRPGPGGAGALRVRAGGALRRAGGVPLLLQPGPGDPGPHQHGPGGAGGPDPRAGQGGAHLPVLRQGLPLYQRGAGGPAGLPVRDSGRKNRKNLREMVDNGGGFSIITFAA